MGRKLAGVSALALLLVPEVAMSAAFATRNESLTLLGQAYGGAASSKTDITSQYFNPATLAGMQRSELSLGTSLILPDIAVQNASGTTAASTPINGTATQNEAAIDSPVPSLYIAHSINPQWTVGIAATVPWGLATDYDSDWVGRYQGVTSKLTSVNISPSVAYQVTNRLALGAGVQFQHTDARLTNAIDCGTLDALPLASGGFGGALGLTPGSTGSDCFADLQGDDSAFGYTLGATLDVTDDLRIAAGYRSEIRHTLKGNVRYDLPNAALATALPDGSADTKLTTPALLTLGVQYNFTSAWAVAFDAHWTQWSSLQQQVVNFGSTQADDVTEYDWEDTWFFALGSTYTFTPQWQIRGGLAYDPSPVPDSTRNVRIPDSDRYWASVGTSYEVLPGFTIDALYMHLFMDDESVNIAGGGANALRGSLNADIKSAADIVALQARYRF